MNHMDNGKARWLRFAPHVFAVVCASLVLAAPQRAADALTIATQVFFNGFDWLVLAAATAAVVLCLCIVVSPVGRLRLGGGAPEFSLVSWWAMLFASGMGAGLVFWGAAEALGFVTTPPAGAGVAPGSSAAADLAMALTLFHWALHPWALYAVSALAVAFFVFRHDAPMTPSAPFAGLGGDGAERKGVSTLRRAIDAGALIAVVFGVVGSLGNGVLQMAAGATALGLSDGALATQLSILAVLVTVYSVSAAGGLKRGIEPLSDFNMALCLCLMAFVLVAGPTQAIFHEMGRSLWRYLLELPRLSVELRPAGEGREWTRVWSLSYLLWWIAWGPFVGVFIARISRGRTLRTFVLGVVLAPSVFTWIWFSVIGGAALQGQMTGGIDLGALDAGGAPMATYALLQSLPLEALSQAAAALLVFTFLVTSADSGAYVLAMFSTGGARRPATQERLFWGLILAALTFGVLVAGAGQESYAPVVTRTFAISGAIPLLFLLIAQGGALLRGLVRAHRDGVRE